MMKKIFVLIFVVFLIVSVGLVSAFSFSDFIDWFKGTQKFSVNKEGSVLLTPPSGVSIRIVGACDCGCYNGNPDQLQECKQACTDSGFGGVIVTDADQNGEIVVYNGQTKNACVVYNNGLSSAVVDLERGEDSFRKVSSVYVGEECYIQ